MFVTRPPVSVIIGHAPGLKRESSYAPDSYNKKTNPLNALFAPC